MKKLAYITTLSLMMFSCGEKKLNVDEVVETNDIKKIREVREQVQTEYDKLTADLAKIDKAIDSLDPNRSRVLVRTITVKDTSFVHYIEIQGNVDTKQNILIYPEISGILQQLNVKAGQKVSKGQVLARIDDGGVSAQLAQAQAQLSLSQTTFDRQKRLWDQKIGSEIQYLQAKTSLESQQKVVDQLQSQLNKSVVRAPFTGTIDEVMTERGKVVAPGQELFRIVNLGDMYVSATVPETYLSQLKLGAPVEVHLNAIGKTYKGKVRQVGNYINPNNRTFGIEVALPNPDNLLRPNQVAVLKIEDYKTDTALLLPETIIQQKAGGRLVVYGLDKSNKEEIKAVEKTIETGYTSKGYVEIKLGIKKGDEIVTDGAKSIKEGSTVEIIK